MLDRGRWHERGVLVDADGQPGRDREARPERIVLVLELRLQPQRAGRGVDLIVGDSQLAGRQRDAVGVFHRDFGLAGRQNRIDATYVVFGRGEDDGYRMYLRDHDDAGLLGGGHHVALVDEAEPGAPGDRGADFGVIELDLRGVDRGHVRGDLGDQLIHERVLRVEL